MIIDTDYIINHRGAKIYKDITKHEILPIPKIKSTEENGVVYKVLSIGIAGDALLATIEEDNQISVYRLPEEYRGWVMSSMMLETSLLPSEIEFGCIDKHYFAEFLF